MYKYEIENELRNMPDIDLDYFMNYLDKLTKFYNKIILFKNKKEKLYIYYCTRCKTWHTLYQRKVNDLKKGEYIRCNTCKTRLEIIYSHNIIKPYQTYITLVDINKRNELIIRVFFYEKIYEKKHGQFYEEFYEVERMNIDQDIEMKNNSYKVMGNYNIYHRPTQKGWIRDRSEFYQYYCYDQVISSQRNIKKIIAQSKNYKYSCLDIATKNNIDIFSYIKLWKSYPKIELLMKAGCIHIINDMCKYYNYGCHPSILNNLKKEEINVLRKYDLSYKELEQFLELGIDNYDLLKKAAKINYYQIRLNPNVEKLINYIYLQNYSLRDYEDYLEWCNFLGMDLKNKNVLYPKKIKEAHDIALEEKIKKERKIYDEKIARYAKELEKYVYKNRKYIIVPARSQTELINESKELNHCVRSYAEAVSQKKTSIFFIRKIDEKNKPFVTLEKKNNKVIQCRAARNKKPLDDVVCFVNRWCKKFKIESCFDINIEGV